MPSSKAWAVLVIKGQNTIVTSKCEELLIKIRENSEQI